MAAPDARRLLGQVISGRYRIDELIGEGGMGAIYRATHTHMRKRLAVKVLHAEMLGLEEAVLRFEREAIAGAHIDHPNVATATDFGKLDDGSHFLVLELLEGEDLRSVIARGPMPPDRATRIARQIALALRATHQLGIVHRDLKPENIMLVRRDREQDVVKVLDFGIAKVPVDQLAKAHGTTAAALTQRGMVYGTPEYMAPEQALGEDVDGRADLYALGVIYFEMLTGSRPFSAPSRAALLEKVVREPPPALASKFPPGAGPPQQLEEIVAKLLAKTPAARMQSADDVIDAIDVAIFEQGWVTPPVPAVAARATLASAADQSGDHPAARAADPAGHTAVAVPWAKRAGADMSAADVSGPRAAILPDQPPRADRVPPRALLTGAGAVAIGALVVAAVMLRGSGPVAALEAAEARPVTAAAEEPRAGATSGAPTASAAASTEPASERRDGLASTDELAAARAVGLAALGPLAQKYPQDPNVLEALLLAHAAERSGLAAAMAVARRLLEVAPDRAADEDVRATILRAANGTPEAAQAAFDVITTRMGSRGPDLLYELVTAPSVGKLPRDRAESLLRDPKVRKIATPALLVALDLRAAQPCNRKPLFARAGEHGDVRSLHYLRPLLVTNGCTTGGGNPFAKLFGQERKVDCYKCLGDRSDLRAAIQAIEQRASGTKGEADAGSK